MYTQYFGLKYVPFAKNSPCLLIDEQHDAFKQQFSALLNMPGIGLLTGEPGVGKTALIRHIVQTLNPHQYQVFYLTETQFTSFDIYRQIALQFGIRPNHRFAQLWRDIKIYIRERYENNRGLPLLIIDEAQNLPDDFFRGFPSFLNFDFDAKSMVTVWFVGHPILANIMDRVVNSALSSRIQARYHIHAIFERDRFVQLLQQAFKEAGAQSSLLSDSGIELLRVASQGRLRTLHNLLLYTIQLATKKNLNYLPDDLLQEAILTLKG